MSKLYKSYVFKDKDPVVAELRAMIEDYQGEKIKGKHLAEIERGGGPSASAMRAWFFGDTRRPQSSAVEAAGRCIGYKRTWVKMK
jgi:hypothetical protein